MSKKINFSAGRGLSVIGLSLLFVSIFVLGASYSDTLAQVASTPTPEYRIHLPFVGFGASDLGGGLILTTGGTLRTADGMATVIVRSDAVTSTVQLSYNRAKWHHPVPQLYVDAHLYFNLGATRLTDNASLDRLRVGSGKPSQASGLGNMTITVNYSSGVVPKSLEKHLGLALFNQSIGAWIFLDSTVDPLKHTVTAYTDQLGDFALLTRPQTSLSSSGGRSAIESVASFEATSSSGPPAGVIVVDSESGVGSFARFGPPNYWWERQDSGSYGGKMWYTWNTNYFPGPTNWATWTTPALTEAGDYTILACIPLANATTSYAKYKVTDGSGTTSVIVNQLTNRGFCANLGTYPYTVGEQGQVYLDDIGATGLPNVTEQYGYDAVIWLPPSVTWTITQTLVPYDQMWALLGLPAWSGTCCEPVSTAFGNFYTQHQDLFVPGVGLNVDFTRAYNSYDTRLGSFGMGTSYTYDIRAIDRGNGEIIVTLADGRAGLYVPDGSGGYERPDGFFGELTKSGGKLTLTDVDQTVYTFNIDGTLASIADPNDNTLEFDYDREGYTLTDTVGRTFRVDFNTDGYITQITDPIGRTYNYEYEEDKLIAFHNAGGGTITYTYDGKDRMETITDPNTHTFVTNHYDSEGRIDWQKDASQITTTLAYTESPLTTTILDNEGNQTIHEFDDQYRLVKETDALGNVMEYEYDQDNNRTYVKDRNGHETFMEYDGSNLIEVTDALSQTATFDYDNQNNLIYARDESDAETFYTYDGVNLTHIQDAEDGDTYLTYFDNGLLETLTDANAHQTQFSYDADGNLETVEDAAHNVTSFEHDDVGRRTAMTDANGHTVEFVYDPNDRITTIIDPKDKPTIFEYDPVGNLTSVTDRRNFETTYEYNENDSLITVTDPRDNVATFTYDKMYHRTSFTNWREYTTHYDYDPVYNLEHVTDAKGKVTTFGYDADHNLVSVTDALTQTTNFGYDPLDRVITVTNALTGTTAYVYDPVGRPVRVLDPKGGITRYGYDQLGRVITTTDALINLTQFNYDPVGNLTSTVNARGFPTTYAYDAVNQLIQIMDPLSHTAQLGYDGVGNVLTLTNPLSHTTLFAYDENDNLRQVTDALNGLVRYSYDEEDNRLSVTDQNTHTTQFAYDPLSNLISVTLPLSQTTLFQYDENSNLIDVINAKDNTTHFEYDELDLLKSRTDPLTFTTAYDYDDLRRLIKVTDAENHATEYEYDPLDRLITVIDALNQATGYEYDPLGNLTAYTDANENTTRFGVDLLGRVISETNPIESDWEYQYDPVGNLIQRTDANGAVTGYTFDADNRLTHITYPSLPGVDYTYDANNNLTGLVDSSGASAFDYDALDRLTDSRRTAGLPLLVGTVLHYDYDPAGNRTHITYPDTSKVVDYVYNANDWLTSVTDPMTGTTTYQYDDVGLPTHVAYPNGTWADYTYDAADRLTNLFNGKPDASSNIISSFDYTLDKVGNITQTVEKVTRGQILTWTKDYTYDELYRLKKSVFTPDLNPYQVLTSDFTYDPVGNRLSQTTNIADQPNTPALDPPVTTNYVYNNANQLLSTTSPLTTTQFAYDNNGNRLSMIGTARVVSYTFDIENRLIGAVTFDVHNNDDWHYDSTLDFTYDGLGRRMERGIIDNGVRKVAEFLYDGLSYDLMAQYVDPGSPRTTYYYRDLTQILSRHEIQGDGSGLQYFHHYDGLGDTSAWTNQSGMETQEYMYAPYGRLIDNNGPDNSSNQTDPHTNLTWSGKPWDPETELNYFGARDYDSTTGTWIEQDPYRGRLMEPMTLHRTMYVNDNPINLVDWYGFMTSGCGVNMSCPYTPASGCGVIMSCPSDGYVSRARDSVIVNGTQNDPASDSLNGGTRPVGCGVTMSCPYTPRSGCGVIKSCAPSSLTGCGYNMSCPLQPDISEVSSAPHFARFDFLGLGRERNLWPTKKGRPSNFNPSLRLAVDEGEIGKEKDLGYGWKRHVGQYEYGAGADWKGKKGPYIGLYGEATGLTLENRGTVVGDRNLGVTGGLTGEALKAEGFFGVHDKSIGASAGVKLISGEARAGLNLAGYNVALVGEAGLKLELGVQVGKKNRLKLGPVTVGLDFGGAE